MSLSAHEHEHGRADVPYSSTNANESTRQCSPSFRAEGEPFKATSTLAPQETTGLLGREVTLLSAVMLNVGQMTGSGIYAVPGNILHSVGSVGLFLAYWILSPLCAFAALSIYAEYASLFPHRSGAEVVYLEQAYPKPRFLVSIMFATTVILTSLNASNAIIFAQYCLSALDIPVRTGNQTLVAMAVVIVTACIVILSTKWAIRVVNVLTIFKVMALVFMVASGVAVLAGLTRITDPYANFKHPFAGSVLNGNALATAFVKSNHAFSGWANAFNLLGEIRSNDPARTVRKASRISLLLVSVLFLFINVAYVAAIPIEEIRSSGQLVAVLFFRRIFGPRSAKFFPLLVSLSCFGNIIAVNLGQARLVREIARQGLLPYPAFFSSIKPFGTPLGPIALRSTLTSLLILIVPAKDAFNFIVDLVSYPSLIFQSAVAYGIWQLRRRRREDNLPSAPLKANNIGISLYLAVCILLLVLPWAPPEAGHIDVSFWYATYCVAGTALLLFCALYYWLWIIYLPKRGNYDIVEEIEESMDGVRNAKLTRRYKRAYVQEGSGERQPLLRDV